MFRIYDKEFKTYVSRGEYNRDEGVLVDEKGNCYEVVDGKVVNNPEYLSTELSSGIPDKEGHIIYQNDIIEFTVGSSVMKMKVTYDRGMFYMINNEVMIPIRFDLFFELDSDEQISNSFKIIGNYNTTPIEILKEYQLDKIV